MWIDFRLFRANVDVSLADFTNGKPDRLHLWIKEDGQIVKIEIMTETALELAQLIQEKADVVIGAKYQRYNG